MHWMGLPLVQFLANGTRTDQTVFLTDFLSCFYNMNAKATTTKIRKAFLPKYIPTTNLCRSVAVGSCEDFGEHRFSYGNQLHSEDEIKCRTVKSGSLYLGLSFCSLSPLYQAAHQLDPWSANEFHPGCDPSGQGRSDRQVCTCRLRCSLILQPWKFQRKRVLQVMGKKRNLSRVV